MTGPGSGQNPGQNPGTMDCAEIAKEALWCVEALMVGIPTRDALVPLWRGWLGALEAEQAARRKLSASWERWTLGYRAMMLVQWHHEDIARQSDMSGQTYRENRYPDADPSAKPIWRAGHIGLRTVVEALGGPPPQPFTTPESGGARPPGWLAPGESA